MNNWKKSFFTIWIGQNFSILGSSLVHFALVWWMTQQTGSAKVLATAVAITYIPKILLGPFLGAVIDRVNRRLMLILSDGFIALVTLILVYLFWSGQIQVWHLYGVVFLRSLGEVVHWPTMQAAMPLMVPEKHLPRINGLNQAIQGGLNIAAPPLGAILLNVLPMYGVISVELITALAAILPLLFLRFAEPEMKTSLQPLQVNGLNLWTDVKDGVKGLYSLPGMRLITSVSIMMNFLMTPVFSLLPLLVTRHFLGGVWHLSVIESAVGIGLVGGGLLIGVWGGFRSKVTTLIAGVVGIGLGILGLGVLSKELFPLAVTGMFISSAANSICNATLFSILQVRIPREMQGRTFSILISLSGLMAPLGLMVSAPAAEYLGIQFWYVMAGCLTLTAAALLVFSRKALSGIEELAQERKPVLKEGVGFARYGD